MISHYWTVGLFLHFKKNADLFPVKISNSLNRCPMEPVVIDGHWDFTKKCVQYKDSNGRVVKHIESLEYDLPKVVLRQMNKTCDHVPSPEVFEMDKGSLNNLITAMITEEAY
jgi:hypothetical protein